MRRTVTYLRARSSLSWDTTLSAATLVLYFNLGVSKGSHFLWVSLAFCIGLGSDPKLLGNPQG